MDRSSPFTFSLFLFREILNFFIRESRHVCYLHKWKEMVGSMLVRNDEIMKLNDHTHQGR